MPYRQMLDTDSGATTSAEKSLKALCICGLVWLGILPRFVAGDTKGFLAARRRPSFDDFGAALLTLQMARDEWSLLGYDCTGLHILDRRTGLQHAPSPQKIRDILDEY